MDMADVQELLNGVTLDSGLKPEDIELHEKWGFMYAPGQAPADSVCVIGYAPPYLPGGTTPSPNISGEVVPVTRIEDVPASLREGGIKHLSKGVGTRFYNTQEAARSGSDLLIDDIGIYALDILVS